MRDIPLIAVVDIYEYITAVVTAAAVLRLRRVGHRRGRTTRKGQGYGQIKVLTDEYDMLKRGTDLLTASRVHRCKLPRYL